MTSSRKPAHPPIRDPEGEEFRQHPRPSGRRILFFSFLASAIIHLVVVFIFPIVMIPEISDRAETEAPEPEIAPDELRVLVLRELMEAEEEAQAAPEEDIQPEAVEEEPETTEPEPEEEVVPEPVEPDPEVTAPPVTEAPDPEAQAPPVTAAERLHPQMVDPRLWRDVAPDAAVTDEDRVRIRVYTLMEAWADSMAVLDEAERRALDWTFTDEEGGRWGISPGRIHLGEFSLPLPIHFGTPPGIRDEVERRAWVWEEIERGAASAAVRDALKDRAQEIRNRRNAERADTLGINR